VSFLTNPINWIFFIPIIPCSIFDWDKVYLSMFGMKLRTMGIQWHTILLHVAVYIHVGSFFMDKIVYSRRAITRFLFSAAAMTLFIAVIFISFGGKNIELTYI
jgi:hypothetical protein